ncbi:MATE family efflux transporter [Anaerocolumna sedimenticola]|uniref:Probable multidrug resistance protein NorM n=1 Tax=Anaerocolumna sedimenticola TaxID=2696063 RepID=A0A6P1TNB0_9FIRM|nr:MATE family efflux transporter [Anaerocolumna sedimenticola]QHQ61672.1 MATE family efflux transporter [Anaerocolumna sedimenticola]
MVDRAFYKRLFILAIPIALQNIVTYSVGLTDNVMVGSLGEVAISGVYLCNQIQIILQMLVAGIGAALIVLAAQYWGKNDKESTKNIMGIGLKIASACAVIFFILVFFFTDQFLSLFSDNTMVVAEAGKYAKIICFTYLFFCISNVLNATLRCIGTVKIGLYLSIVSFFLNVTLNWVFIFGNLGAPALGIRGAAIATLISRLVEFSCYIIYMRFMDNKLKMYFKDVLHTNMELVKDFFRYGLPVIMGDVLWGINLAVQGAIVGRLGADSIAAVSIANIVFSVVSVGVYGIASASAVIIGNAAGEGDLQKIKAYTKKLQAVFLIGGICTGLFLFLIKDYVLLLYNVSEETLNIAKALMTVLSVTVIGTAYQMSTLTGIVRAGGATHFVLINDIIFVWFIVIPLSLIMAFVIGAPTWVVFLCLKCDQILKCAVAVVKVNRFDWIKKLTKEFA